MSGDPILRTVARFAVPLTVWVSLVIFMQGHNLPGGGFIAGVMAAAAGAMYLLAFGPARAARYRWWKVSVFGLLVSVTTGAVIAVPDEGCMEGWTTTFRGAFPTGMVVTTESSSRFTTERSLDPSFVT